MQRTFPSFGTNVDSIKSLPSFPGYLPLASPNHCNKRGKPPTRGTPTGYSSVCLLTLQSTPPSSGLMVGTTFASTDSGDIICHRVS